MVVSINGGDPQNGWFIRDMFTRGTPIYGHLQMLKQSYSHLSAIQKPVRCLCTAWLMAMDFPSWRMMIILNILRCTIYYDHRPSTKHHLSSIYIYIYTVYIYYSIYVYIYSVYIYIHMYIYMYIYTMFPYDMMLMVPSLRYDHPMHPGKPGNPTSL